MTRVQVTDEEWAFIEPYLPVGVVGSEASAGAPAPRNGSSAAAPFLTNGLWDHRSVVRGRPRTTASAGHGRSGLHERPRSSTGICRLGCQRGCRSPARGPPGRAIEYPRRVPV